MIKYYYKSVRDETLIEKDSPQRGTWVYVESPTDIEVTDLTKRFDLEPGLIEDALDEDEMASYGARGRPKLYIHPFCL